VILSLSEEPGDTEAEATWQGKIHADGSYSPLGEVDFVRANAGSGRFEGRYLRISSSSTVAYSPQIAEVEVYESLLPTLVNLRADGQNIDLGQNLVIAPGVRWLAFTLKALQKHLPKKVLFRWRMQSPTGVNSQWALANSEGVAEGVCPPPGRYTFEAQLGHTDGEWNEAALKIPVVVETPWWKNLFVQATSCAALLGLVIWLIRHFARRKLELQLRRLEQLQALNEERARIARDMHDVVGARLTQLCVLHDIFAKQHTLSSSGAASLKQLAGTAREAIAALDEVVWTVNPRNDSLTSFADYICHCATEYLSPLQIACLQDVPTDWPDIHLGAQTRHEILLAFKEALQNIVKHAEATEVFLVLRCENETFSVRVEDNGKGLPLDILGKEKDGLSNMTHRLSRVGGTCQILPRVPEGTAVLMQVPLSFKQR
ncbi:MAG: histidine kinase, partial [Verrucomicrobia bacterium]|nr:histidine kinase [Verrucomicrobiota bacterium]